MTDHQIDVLVVEDNPVDARLVEIMLSGVTIRPGLPGFRIHKAPTLDQALAMLAQAEYHIVLLDLSLPDSHGLETLQRMLEVAPNLPIIVLSGLDDEAVALQAVNEGAQDYLVKGQGDEILLSRSIRYALERQQADAALQASEHRFRALIENSTEAVVLLNVQGRTIYRSPTAARLMRIPPGEPPADNPFENVHPDDLQEANSLFQKLLTDPTAVVQTEVRVQRRDGVWRWFEAIGSNMLNEPGVEAIVVNYRDITERKERERELEAIAAINAALRKVHNRADTMRLVLDFVTDLLNSHGGAFAMDNGHGELVIEVATGTSAHRQGIHLSINNSLSGLVLSSGEPIVSDNIQDDPRYSAHVDATRGAIFPIACVPLIAQELPIGVLWVARDAKFEDADILLLETLADIAASAIYRITLLEQTRQHSQRLLALHKIDVSIAAKLPLDEILDTLLSQALEQLHLDAAMILICDSSKQRISLSAHKGFRTDPSTQNLLMRDFEEVCDSIQNRQLLVMPDLSRGFSSSTRNDLLVKAESFVFHCAAPLYVHEQVIGLMELYQRTPRTLEQEELEFLESLAAQASIAIESARLYTETQRLLEQTQSQARQLQKIIESVPDGIVLIDNGHRVRVANPSAQEYLPLLAGHPVPVGSELVALAGLPIDALLHPSSTHRPVQELAVNGPLRHRFEIAAHPLQQESNAQQWVFVLRDVTQKRDLQDRLQQHEQLATVGQLAAGIAHDFNNVIGAILLQTHLLSKTGGLAPHNQKRLEMIAQQSQYAANLVRQILDFSRQSVMERQSINLRPLVAEQVKLLQRTIPATIRVELNAPEAEYWVNVDVTRVQQVLMNLALNAQDAMPNGGTLRFSIENLNVQRHNAPLDGLAPGMWLRLTVSDTGTGIPKEIINKIFDPFFTTKGPDRGTGLGLSQVYGIVKQHEGEIAVESTPGQGSAFTIYFPAGGGYRQVAEVADALPAGTADAETILLAEDNEPLRDAMQNMLEELGYRILVAGNGHEALEVFQKSSQIDLVLSDLVMPEMGGVELCEALQRIRPDVKMMIISGYPLETRGKELLQKGIIDWVQKPFTVTDLANKVRACLSQTGTPPAG